MQVQEALLIEGTSKFGILCYGIFRPSELDSAYQAISLLAKPEQHEIHTLFDDQWPNFVLLIETFVESFDDIQKVISNTFSCMFQSGNCLAALCMYDGGFFGYDDIFGYSVANQTYAFCFSKDHSLINLDADCLSSSEWASIIIRCRKRLDSF
ncbi:MAG: hypothetical protein J0M09_18700 [Xanthomonadales bacterium]|nr:hypothetical protein [Xanthomonadales bacterium]